jgi:pantoate--beta-alanine ligase
VAEMYPEPTRTTVHVAGLTEELCGAARPTHFDGVTTVVTKLFGIVGPCTAYFGRKDLQQLTVVRRMTADLNLPVEVVGCPLVREPDGVAMSSRNAYLAPEERAAAGVLYRALRRAADAVGAGERSARAVRDVVVATVAGEPLVTLEYAEVRRTSDLEPIGRLDGEVLVAVAARVGATRLIDNVLLKCTGAEVTADLGVITQGSSA